MISSGLSSSIVPTFCLFSGVLVVLEVCSRSIVFPLCPCVTWLVFLQSAVSFFVADCSTFSPGSVNFPPGVCSPREIPPVIWTLDFEQLWLNGFPPLLTTSGDTSVVPFGSFDDPASPLKSTKFLLELEHPTEILFTECLLFKDLESASEFPTIPRTFTAPTDAGASDGSRPLLGSIPPRESAVGTLCLRDVRGVFDSRISSGELLGISERSFLRDILTVLEGVKKPCAAFLGMDELTRDL